MRYAVVLYTDTTSKEAVADFAEQYRRRKQRERRRQQRRWYFIKQRLSGITILILTVLAIKTLDGDATIALFTVPLGLYTIFTKEMLIVNDFYWQTKERKKNYDTNFRTIWRDR